MRTGQNVEYWFSVLMKIKALDFDKYAHTLPCLGVTY